MIHTATKTSLITLTAIILCVTVIFPATAQASNHCPGDTGLLGFPTWYQYLDTDSECNVSPIRDGGEVNLGATLGAVLLAITEILLRIAGLVAIGFVIYGGILFTVSQGSPDRLQAAQKTIINGLIGLVIAVLAVAIVGLFSNVVTNTSSIDSLTAQQVSSASTKERL